MKAAALLFTLLTASLPALAESDPWFAARKLRQHCRACHGLGEMRFIFSDNDQENWEYLFNNRAPKSGKIWAVAIVEVLSWPSDSPPPFNQMLNPPDKDWMPKGSKRLKFASDTWNGESVRKLIIEDLRLDRLFDGP